MIRHLIIHSISTIKKYSLAIMVPFGNNGSSSTHIQHYTSVRRRTDSY